MKPFHPTSLKITALSLCIMTLGACQAYEGLREDIAGIDFSKFKTASSVSPDAAANSNFLVDGDCPKVEIVDELSMLHDFNDARKPSESSRISTVTFTDARSTCDYAERSVTVDLKLDLSGEIGPAGRANASDKPFFKHPYFVAVTSANNKILAKELFDASMTYEPGETIRNYTENLRQLIPTDSRSDGAKLKVIVGFQLTQEQLAYNRAIIQRREATKIAFEKQQEALRDKITTTKVTTQKAPQIAIPKVTPSATEAPIINAPIPPQKNPEYLYTPPETPEPPPVTNRAGPIDITTP